MLNKEKIKQLLDTAYELEGLLQLADSREEVPAQVETLIREKIDLLIDAVSLEEAPVTKVPEETPETEAPHEEFIDDLTDEMPEEDVPEEDLPEEIELPEASVNVVEVNESSFESYDLDDEPEDSQPERAPEVKPAATPIFSINDRFLYSRELFGGSISDFEDALKDVASMETYEEAEEYFISEAGFNPESPVVQSFLAIIEKCF